MANFIRKYSLMRPKMSPLPQEDNPEHRHAVFDSGQLGVGVEIVCRVPEIGFKARDVSQSVLAHVGHSHYAPRADSPRRMPLTPI
jgi:hypothetical protein